MKIFISGPPSPCIFYWSGRRWLSRYPEMNFVSGENLCGTCTPLRSLLSPSPHASAVEWSGLSTTEPESISWEPQLPASHQIKWISNWVKAPRLGQAEWRTGGLLLLLCLSWLSVSYLFFSFDLLLRSAPVPPLLSSRPLSLSLWCAGRSHTKWIQARCKGSDTNALPGRQCVVTPALSS